MKKFKRDFFFWIERLQITRKERIVISTLLVLIVLMVAVTSFLKNSYEHSTENYEAIRREFEKKSAALEKKRQEDLKKYSSQVSTEDTIEKTKTVIENNVININKAGVEELQQLKGIGATYAQRIVDYRKENGEFNSIEELLNVKGIGKKRLEDIKAFIILN